MKFQQVHQEVAEINERFVHLVQRVAEEQLAEVAVLLNTHESFLKAVRELSHDEGHRLAHSGRCLLKTAYSGDVVQLAATHPLARHAGQFLQSCAIELPAP